MAQTFSIAVGDTGPDLTESLFAELADGTLVPADLTGATNVTFHLYDENGVEVVTGAAAVLNPHPATVAYAWQAGDTATGGTFLRRWTATTAGGARVSFPNDVDGYPVLITDPAVIPATGRLTCTAWCVPADVVRCAPCSGTAFDTDVLEEACQIASDVLFALSGRQFSGVCPDVIRPIRDDVSGWSFPVVGSYSITYGESFGTTPGMLRHARDYVSDRRHLASEIRLPAYPVNTITQVRIDGAVLAHSEYQIADNRWLQRLKGAWPFWQNVTLPATALGSFEVAYTYGVPIPPMGVRAAAAYACEVAKACQPTGGDSACALPPRTQSIVRQGVSVRMLDPADLLKEGRGRTGLKIVDDFIAAVNPHGIQERAAVLSPDVDWPAIRVRNG